MTALIDSYIWLKEAFWAPRHWLPPGLRWSDLSRENGETYPDVQDMYFPIAFAFVFLLVRAIFEWSIARPLGRLCGITAEDCGSELPNIFSQIKSRFVGKGAKRADQKASANGVTNGTIHYANSHASYANSTVANVNLNSKMDKPKRGGIAKSKLDKFAESCWRGFYYGTVFCYGMYVLWDKPWLWDTVRCWDGFPFQEVTSDIWWYYMLSASFYWSLTFSQFVDTKRKDFTMNFVHHVATIALLWLSWADNVVRAGCLVLVVHDAADFWLEAGKMARYSGHDRVCEGLFAIFLTTWFVTRIGIFPMYVVYTTLFEAAALAGYATVYLVLNSLLLVLLVLHTLWSIMILRILYRIITKRNPGDVRSDDEDSD